MALRKTKTIYITRPATTESDDLYLVLRAYESREMLEEDLQLCEVMFGKKLNVAVTEIPLVLEEETTEPQEAKPRRKPEYPEEFESWWDRCSPKKGKERAYATWKDLTDRYVKDRSERTLDLFWNGFTFASDERTVLERLADFQGQLDGTPAA